MVGPGGASADAESGTSSEPYTAPASLLGQPKNAKIELEDADLRPPSWAPMHNAIVNAFVAMSLYIGEAFRSRRPASHGRAAGHDREH